MLPRITKREYTRLRDKHYSPEEIKLIEAKIVSNPKEYRMNDAFVADGYRGWLGVYDYVSEEIKYGITTDENPPESSELGIDFNEFFGIK